ncbi:MAG: ATP-binding protein [Bryobacteraceae bacterium]
MFPLVRHGRLSGCAALILALGGSGFAQQYSFRHYGAAEGLQNLVILSLAQDGAGYIWAGSEGGLYRYDGTRFRLMGAAEGLPCSNEVHTLHVAADGALWANTCAQILRFDGQRFQAITRLGGWQAGAQSMADGPHGGVLVATPAGLYEALPGSSGDPFRVRPYLLPAELADKPVRGIVRHGSQLWFGCGQRLCLEDGGRVSVFGPESGLPEDSWNGIQVAPDGSVWVRSPSRLYRKPPGATRLVREKPDMASSSFWGALTIVRDGSIMVPSDQGLAIRSESGWSVLDQQNGLRTAMTSAALEDREGSLWIGLIGAGVARWLGRGEWESWTKAQGLPSDLIWSIRRDRRGALWVGTSQGLARLDGPARPRTWTRKDGLGGDNVRWLGETSDGAIWAVTRPGGLARIDPATGKIGLAGRRDGLTCDALNRGFVDRLGRLWLATTCGVFRSDRPAASTRFIRIDQPESLQHAAWSVFEDQQGSIWITNPAGLWRLRDGEWRHYGRSDGLLSDNPYIIAMAADGALWLRHRFDAGVERVEFSGDRIVRSMPMVPADPMSVEVTAFHGFDALGRFWRGGANGVALLDRNSWTDLTTEDGLVWNDTDGEAFWADADGSVWIGTSGGLAHYRPPKGGSRGPPVAAPVITRLEISRWPRLVEAQFSSLNYKSEQLVRFAYRLDGGAWSDAAERSLSIAGLGPGRHRLEVRSGIRGGPPSASVAAAEFQVAPMWWETWWLRSLTLLLTAAAAWGAIRWRQRLLRQRNHELERAVRERTAELEAERAKVLEEKTRADEANQAKSRFLAHMSHEIRTPLNGVIGLSRLLEEMSVPDEARDTLRLIHSSGDALLSVVNGILDFSKIEAGKLDVEVIPFRLRACLEESLEMFRPAAAKKDLGLRCSLAPDVPEWAAGDGTRLRQVLLNLLSNALKFTSSGEVTLSAKVDREDDAAHLIAIEVRDTGIGIPPEDLHSLFNSFSQVDASISRRYGGTGLGLAITKRLVELMGGAISVESKPGVGTRFRFTILLPEAQEPRPAQTVVAPAPGERGLKVLVAEDNPVNQIVVLALLRKLGVNADLATDGSQAVAAVLEHDYDLVLMDMQMPEMDGLAATREIRSRLPADRQPVICALSAHATTDDRDACLRAGMNGFLTKPLEPEKLRNLLAGLAAPSSAPQSDSAIRVS